MLIGFAAALIAALIQSLFLAIDCDVSWLITVNEKLLAGQRLYADVIEANPPASVWLYTPAVWLARRLALRPEAVVVAQFLLAGLLSCAATLKISRSLKAPPNPALVTAVVAFVTLLLPLGNFAQREHAAVLLALPSLTALAVLAEGVPLSLARRLATGSTIGLVIAIKPHFAFAIAPAMGLVWWRAKTMRPMQPIAIAAAAVMAFYAAAVLLFTPQYLSLVPMLGEVYVAQRERWPALLIGPVTVVPLTIFALAFTLRPKRVDALGSVMLIGSGGFAVAALVQGRGYLNHALPATALGLAGIALLALRSEAAPKRRTAVLVAAAALAALELYVGALIRPDSELTRAVARLAPPHPSLITLGPELRTGHPLVRNLDGAWAGSRPALFIAAGAHARLSSERGRDARLLGWYRSDLNSFSNDVARERPDAILVDARPELAWLRADAGVRTAMIPYRPAARVGDTEIWLRRQ
jgi:hypothetical protein